MSPSERGSKLVVFCGKGGVGKTTLSMAFALMQAESGRRVVVVTSHPLKELALSISLAGLKKQHPESAQNLFIIYLNPQEILNEKLGQAIPSVFLRKAVLASRIYKSLIEVAPGLKEIAFLSRLTQLARGQAHDANAPEFDLLVWDAPATGHFLQTLKVSRNFPAYLSGPLAALGTDIADFFSQPDNLLLYTVTTFDDMAVDETGELYASLINDIRIHPSGIIGNMASPWLAARAKSDGMHQDRPPESLQLLWDRFQVEHTHFERLAELKPPQFLVVERVAETEPSTEFLFGISRRLHCVGGSFT